MLFALGLLWWLLQQARSVPRVPAPEDLEPVAGTVESVRLVREHGEFLLVRLVGRENTFVYGDREHRYSRVREALRVGEDLAIWAAPAQFQRRTPNRWIWRLRQGGRELVGYDELVTYRQSEYRRQAREAVIYPVLFFGFGVAAVLIRARLARRE